MICEYIPQSDLERNALRRVVSALRQQSGVRCIACLGPEVQGLLHIA